MQFKCMSAGSEPTPQNRSLSMELSRVVPLLFKALLPCVLASLPTGCSRTGADTSASNERQEQDKRADAGRDKNHKHDNKDERDDDRSKTKHGDHDNESATLRLSEEEITAAGVKVALIDEKEVSDRIALTATIRPNQDRFAHVAPRVEGRIVSVSANLGDRVKAGQTLATLDSLELGEAHSSFLQAQSQYRVAQADLKRAEQLSQEEIIPHKELIRARSEYEKSLAAMRAAEDKLRMLGVPLGKSAGNRAVSVFPLTAPFAGTVIEKKAVQGELATPQESMFTIADLSMVWIEADLYEKDLGRITTGSEAAVTVAAYPDAVFQGRVAYIGAMVDKETRTIKARIEVANLDGRLKPEMFATASIASTSRIGKALVIPEDAVVLMQGEPTVFVAEEHGFEARRVALGERGQRHVVAKSGLVAGEKIVVAGAFTLKARAQKSLLGAGHAH